MRDVDDEGKDAWDEVGPCKLDYADVDGDVDNDDDGDNTSKTLFMVGMKKMTILLAMVI